MIKNLERNGSCHIMNVLGRMVGVGLLEFLRMLLSCKICAFGIILIHPGMAAECTAGDIVIIYL